jgi:hypothetical protein
MRDPDQKLNTFEGARTPAPFGQALVRGFCDVFCLSRALIVAPVRAAAKVLSDFVSRT